MALHNAITDVAGITVGHAGDEEALTGCSVILCPKGAVGGVDQRGGAPGTRETDPLRPMHLVQQVHAVVLAGGSAFGLEAATGVVQFLEENKVGLDVRVARVPIVPAAILFDLALGRPDIRPDAAMGYAACENASSDRPLEGNAGAGTGATAGKALGMEAAMKSGIGTASVDLGQGLIVGALVAPNPFGDVVDPNTGGIIAGARTIEAGETRGFAGALEGLKRKAPGDRMRFGPRENTVIGVVATNARLDKEDANKMAQMAHDGIGRTVRPSHTMLDGDTLFALATGEQEADVNVVGAFAAEVVAEAIVRAVRAAESLGGVPAVRDLRIF